MNAGPWSPRISRSFDYINFTQSAPKRATSRLATGRRRGGHLARSRLLSLRAVPWRTPDGKVPTARRWGSREDDLGLNRPASSPSEDADQVTMWRDLNPPPPQIERMITRERSSRRPRTPGIKMMC